MWMTGLPIWRKDFSKLRVSWGIKTLASGHNVYHFPPQSGVPFTFSVFKKNGPG
jgi:hypothetical protein